MNPLLEETRNHLADACMGAPCLDDWPTTCWDCPIKKALDMVEGMLGIRR